ncbi:hypothetical protein [Nocardioides sp.]|uniref:hypothetical protein n=1 Tax=Nocardioides sp. TaxID=35761 RepID=UPI0039E3F664
MTRPRRLLAAAATAAVAAPALALAAGSPAQAADLVPTVQVSKTTVLADGTTTVTVTGTGFDPSLAIGTRAPLAGQEAGTYVAFGKYAEVWKPSEGASSSSRQNGATGTAVKWAIPEPGYTTLSSSAGAILLAEDGSFTTEITIDKAALDAVATDSSLVNYGIYTYPGSGAVQPLYETYTPITFADVLPATPTVTGTAQVGQTLTAVPGTWEPADVTLAYQWSADGQPITGATSATYVVPGEKVGARLTVSVTGTTGSVSETATSAPTAPVAAGTLTVATPTVKGKAKVGKKLTASVTAPEGAVVTYQWFAGKKAIKGATKATLKLKKKQAGKKITVTATVVSTGYETAAVTSKATKKVKKK